MIYKMMSQQLWRNRDTQYQVFNVNIEDITGYEVFTGLLTFDDVTNPWNDTQTANFQVTRIGEICTFELNSSEVWPGEDVSKPDIISDAIIPTQFRPASANTQSTIRVFQNNDWQFGVFSIGTDGAVRIFNDPDLTTNWTSGAGSDLGFGGGINFAYTV